jgi:aryl-alcohol dehydrogenase-like predicted oxidoreductase
MEYRFLGRTGVRVSPLCLGCMNFGIPTPEQESIRIIQKALDAGLNMLDTADLYGKGESERVVGKALQGGRREKVILATKFYFPTSDDPNDRGSSRRHIMNAVEASLRRLDTGWIDLYQVHRPVFELPQEETLRALEDLVRQGKVRYIGCSTYPAWMVMEALSISERFGWVHFVSEQPPYNLLDRRIENELVPLALRYNLALLPWSPLAMGLLAGRYPDASRPPAGSRAARVGSIYAERVTPQAVEAGAKMASTALEHGYTPVQLALRWVIDQPGITSAIFGPRTMEHLEAALTALEVELTAEVQEAVDRIVPPGGAAANFFNTSGWMKG